MLAKLQSWWHQIKQRPYVAGIVVLLVLILFIFLAYRFGWEWTGFNSGTSQITITNASKEIYTATVSQPGKALWDWLNLLGVLAIPAVVGLGAAWYTAQQGKVSERENTDNQREIALQAYIDKMSELLLHAKLRNSTEKDEVRKIAHVRTLTILARLDGNRKKNVLQILYESGLIEEGNCIVNLSGADLSEALLYGASLSKADLRGADLRGAELEGANLEGASLERASLYKANLNGANLRDASLSEALVNEANLSEANLEGANLEGANFTKEQLDTAKSLKGAIMPDGLIHS